jgi:HSP20 family protein
MIKQFAEQFGFVRKDQVNENKDRSAGDKDFSPPCDVFDTADAYILHFSLPGAKKEDVGVNWDVDNNEVIVSGVVYRPGGEEVVKALALDELSVGLFERKIKLGSKEHPAAVDADSISARMEDGLLIVHIPKAQEEFVEVKKVDIE